MRGTAGAPGPDRWTTPDRRPPGRLRVAARARRGEPVHGPRLPPRRRDDPRRAASRSRSSCATGGCASCAGSGPGSRRGCASWSRRARSPSWPSSSASSRPGSSASGATSGSARSARSRSRGRSASSTPDELREAAAAGRLRTVRGIGPKTEAQLLEALAREAEPRPRRGLLLNRARELVGAIAAALGGEAAGDVRRWRDSCERLAVVCAAADPAPLLARFAALPQIVAVIEQAERRAVGRDGRGRAGRARRRRAASASGPRCARDRRARLRRGARAAARRARRGGRLSRARPPVVPAGAARGAVPRRAAGARRAEATSAATCTATRRGRTAARASRRWAAPPASAATTTSRSATTRRPSAPCAGSRADDVRRQARGDRRGQRAARPVPRPARDRVRHPPRRPARPPRRRPGRARLGPGERARRAADAADGDDQARRGGAAQPLRELPEPSRRAGSSPAARRTPSTSSACTRSRSETGVALEVNGLSPRLDLRGEHVREALRAGVQIVCSTDAHSTRGLGNMTLSVHTARRGWATRRRRPQHPTAGVDPRRAARA